MPKKRTDEQVQVELTIYQVISNYIKDHGRPPTLIRVALNIMELMLEGTGASVNAKTKYSTLGFRLVVDSDLSYGYIKAGELH